MVNDYRWYVIGGTAEPTEPASAVPSTKDSGRGELTLVVQTYKLAFSRCYAGCATLCQ